MIRRHRHATPPEHDTKGAADGDSGEWLIEQKRY